MSEREQELLERIAQLEAQLAGQKKPTAAQRRKATAPKGRAARAITEAEYHELIETMRKGGVNFEPSDRNATAFVVQANLGLRIGDVVNITHNSFTRTDKGWRLNVVEEKTGKAKTHHVPNEVYQYIEIYRLQNDIGLNDKLFPVTVRNLQYYLKKVVEYLDLPGNIGTHSFRKMYATKAYENSGRDIRLVQQLMNHGSAETTERYIGIQSERIESTIEKNVDLR